MKDNSRKSKAFVLWPRDVLDRYGISASTLWRWEKEGYLPSRDFSIGDRSGWTVNSLEKFEASAQEKKPK